MGKQLFLFLATAFLLKASISFGQTFDRQYDYGKYLMKQGKYASAMEVFRASARDSKEADYYNYACYFYAHCAYKINEFREARMWLSQLERKSPDWDKIDEVYYLIGLCEFEAKAPEDALLTLEKINSKEMQHDVYNLKRSRLMQFPLSQVQFFFDKDPTDDAIAEALFNKMQQQPAALRDQDLYELLKGRVGVVKTTGDRPSSYNQNQETFKDIYDIVVLMPFLSDEKESALDNRRYQFIYELYSGIQSAAKLINLEDTVINIMTFDTKKDSATTANILLKDEVRNADLIIGPLYPNTVPLVKEFSFYNKIPMLNPISSNDQVISGNPYSFLAGSTLQSQAKSVARYIKEGLKYDTAYVVFGLEKKSPEMAKAFKEEYQALGGSIKSEYAFNYGKKGFEQLLDTLTGINDTSSCLFVSSSEMLVALNVIGAVQNLKFEGAVIANDDWLNFSQVKFNQLEQNNIHIYAPQFERIHRSSIYNKMLSEYVKDYNILPSKYAKLGFEATYTFGLQLVKHGKKLPYLIHEEPFLDGIVYTGADYTEGNDNQYVPILQFKFGHLEIENELEATEDIPMEEGSKE